MPAQLLALTDGPSILLDKPILLLGRHPECDIQLNSRKVSRRHCCIAQVRDYLVVRDLGSTNGVRINGDRVLEGKLKAGDELTIGNFKYQICWDVPAEPGPGPLANGKKAGSGRVLSKPVDQLLEDADEPIPLDEDAAGSMVLEAKPAEPLPKSPPAATAAANNVTFKDKDEASILPSNLDLVPPADAAPPPTSHG
jgi:predicted component of type VI protein secretion system